MVADVPTVIENLADFVIKVVRHLHQTFDPVVVLGPGGVFGGDELEGRIVVERVAGSGRRITLQIIQFVDGHAAMVTDELGVLLFFKIMQAPIFAVEKDNTESRGLVFRARFRPQRLQQFVAHERQMMVVTGGAQQQMLDLSKVAVGKKPVLEPRASLAAGAVEIEAFEREPA